MVPILFAPSATSFNTNGLGRLADTISYKVIEELNGQYELELTYPKDGRLFSSICYSAIIVCKPFQNGNLQAFRIYKISKPMKGNVTVYARHITYQLNHIPCSAFSGQTCAQVLAAIPTAVAEYCPFTFTTDVITQKTSVSKNLLSNLDTSAETDWTAPAYNANMTYAVGEYCSHDNRNYRCIVTISQPEAWNASHWEQITIPPVGYINARIENGCLIDDETAISVWVKCEKSKKYQVSKMLGRCFSIATLTQPPSEGKAVQNVVSDPSQRKLEYTTNATAEYMVVYIYRESLDGANTYEAMINSASIRAIGTYTWMLYEPKCIRTFLLGEDDNSIQAIYGGEYEWDNYHVILHQNRGSNKGVKIRYGKNLIDLTQEENIENTITGIYPIWKSEGTVVELPEKVVHAANASNYPYLRTVIQDFTSDFDQMPTVEELREYANLYIQDENIGVPEVCLTVNFVNLAETMEYSGVGALQTVNLGDIVTVEFPELGVSAQQKVTKTEYDGLNERYTSITIGNLEKTIDTTLEDQMNQLQQKVSQEEAQNAIDRATGVMNAGVRGHVIIGRNDNGFANEIFFLDNQNVALAKNVLRINVNGIGFSSNGLRGPYYQAWTLDGHLSLGGINNSHGTLEILDANGVAIGRWDNEKLWVNQGIIEAGQFRSKNGEFYVMENGEGAVEVGWSGWDVWNNIMQSQEMAWRSNDGVNPASDTSASAAINGGCESSDDDYEECEGEGMSSRTDGFSGTAGFKALWLDDIWFEGGSTNWSYDAEGRNSHHLWDVAETLRWIVEGEKGLNQLNTRVAYLEQHGGGGCTGGDECNCEGECGDFCHGEGCPHEDDECPFYDEGCSSGEDCDPIGDGGVTG